MRMLKIRQADREGEDGDVQFSGDEEERVHCEHQPVAHLEAKTGKGARVTLHGLAQSGGRFLGLPSHGIRPGQKIRPAAKDSCKPGRPSSFFGHIFRPPAFEAQSNLSARCWLCFPPWPLQQHHPSRNSSGGLLPSHVPPRTHCLHGHQRRASSTLVWTSVRT